MKQELFAVGKWNGMAFTLADLKSIAANFSLLKKYLQVPLKLGHNDAQAVTDGQPALGWITAVEVIGEKLVGTFESVPSIVQNAFDKKLYRNVSIELDFDVTHKDVHYDFVLTAVALLGADMPAVNTLNDLGAFLASRNSELAGCGYSANRQATFTSITGTIKETIMTPEEIAAMVAANAALKLANDTLTTQIGTIQTSLENQTATFAADKLKNEASVKRVKFTAILEKAVTDKIILPAQREAFSGILKLDDDAAVMALEEPTVTALFAGMTPKGKDTGLNDDGTPKDEEDEDPSVKLSAMTFSHMAKSGSKDFAASMEIVMLAEPELARAYIDSNGEVE